MIKPLILDVLKQLKSQVDNKDIPIPYYLLHSGICYCTYYMLYDQKEDELAHIRTTSSLSINNLINITFKPYFEKWPKFSGEEEFPVPNPMGGCPRHTYWNTSSMWTGEYGRLRIELLDFLISELSEQLAVNRFIAQVSDLKNELKPA